MKECAISHPFVIVCRFFGESLYKLFINRENFGKMDNLHYLLHKRRNLRLSKHLPKIWNSRAHFILGASFRFWRVHVLEALFAARELVFFRHLSSFADVNRV